MVLRWKSTERSEVYGMEGKGKWEKGIREKQAKPALGGEDRRKGKLSTNIIE